MSSKKALRPAQRRELVEFMRDNYRAPIRRCCLLAMLSSSVWYYRPHPRDDKHVRIPMLEIASVRIRYGFCRVYILLRREGFAENHKHMCRIYKEEGLNLRSKRPRRNKATAQRMERPELSTINISWRMDFVADQHFDGRTFRVLTVLDNYSRKGLAIHSQQSIKGGDVVEVLELIKDMREVLPKVIQVDNGSEFISKSLDRWAYDNDVTMDFSRPGKPTENPFIESFNGSFRDECLNVNWFLSLEDAKKKIEDCREEYNTFGPHSSLNDLTPHEVLDQELKKVQIF